MEVIQPETRVVGAGITEVEPVDAVIEDERCRNSENPFTVHAITPILTPAKRRRPSSSLASERSVRRPARLRAPASTQASKQATFQTSSPMFSVRAAAPPLRSRSRVDLCATAPRCHALMRPLLRNIPTRRFYAHGLSVLRNTYKNIRKVDQFKNEDNSAVMRRAAQEQVMKNGGGPLFPGTFVALPLSQCPRNPVNFAKYQWFRLYQSFATLTTILGLRLQSMPSWTKRPRWRSQRAAIVPTARALHRDVLEAFAAGDRATLLRLCLPDFANRLIAAIDRRDPRELVRFKFLRYNKPLLYPRLLSRQVHAINMLDKSHMTEQVVVAVASTQRTSKHDAKTKELIPGSSKQQDKIEYVVLSRQVNVDTYENGEWRMWGTTAATTLEFYLEEQVLVEREAEKRLEWKGSSAK